MVSLTFYFYGLQDGFGLKKKKQLKKVKKHSKDLEVGVSEPSTKKQKKNVEKAKSVLDSIEPLGFKVMALHINCSILLLNLHF